MNIIIRVALNVALIALVACGKGSGTQSVTIHAVNYSGDEFSYRLVDPANSANAAGGELIPPYAAGGAVCCYELPKQWRPGTQVRVVATRYMPKTSEGVIPEVKTAILATLPPYSVNGAADLWLIRGKNGEFSVLNSEFQPDHPKWPGTVKGWPVPSAEYRREIWVLHRDKARSDVELFESLLRQLQRNPQKRADEAWQSLLAYEPNKAREFAGPNDERFRAYLRTDYTEALLRARDELKKIEQDRP